MRNPKSPVLSFTKNLGGFEVLFRSLRTAYRRNIATENFKKNLATTLKGRELLIHEFFIATQIKEGTERVFSDILIEETISRDPLDICLKRLYLLGMLLNLPGQRSNKRYRSPARAQNLFVRSVLWREGSWRKEQLQKDSMESWFETHVDFANAEVRRKFVNNFHYYFRQCQFMVNRGSIIPGLDLWGKQAIRLYIQRIELMHGKMSASGLINDARSRQLNRLMGTSIDWVDDELRKARRP